MVYQPLLTCTIFIRAPANYRVVHLVILVLVPNIMLVWRQTQVMALKYVLVDLQKWGLVECCLRLMHSVHCKHMKQLVC